MTQSAPFHRRSPSSPHASKSKTTRPAIHRRGNSHASTSISKLGSGQRGACKPTTSDDTEFDMASFLNFCAMCENQITVPNNTLLYCSESCRRKDSRKPLSASLPSMSAMSTMSTMSSTTPPTSPPLSPRTIVAPMIPTRIPSTNTSLPSTQIFSHTHSAKSDLDPTEWKPVLSRASSLASSEAWTYLSQFHRGSSDPLVRPTVYRSSSSLPALAAGASHNNTMPALTSAPSTVASSYSSTASDYLGMYESSRPLPPRHNPYSGTSATKGVELVVPHIVSEHEDLDPVSDRGSILPASSAVWETSYKKSAPINMGGMGGRRAECVKN
ncbi:uncharacterized protein N7515_003808 [Penicillium bovifimosum]|uniref:Life-span regulatory factor-domain-containing protein n=1 Tax=Penicillium bovifimosum TaxID=126998 RepID=A0A9W9L6K1_9EURO|nr:uncharacterized protein N7515_003808 [Penicillium bovifimosum]KAJ5138960.1 hypothetical protein N7515_003808 [Penicillium bovifimosum]